MKRRPVPVASRSMLPASRAVSRVAMQRGASDGHALDAAVRGMFESRFGHDFGAVRVHHDGTAAREADALGAAAFTLGEDIHFAAGRYAPGSLAGQALLAHELAHTVQQSGATRGRGQSTIDAHSDALADAHVDARAHPHVDRAAERDASTAAARVMRGQSSGALMQTALAVACAPARQPKGTSGHLAFDNGWSYIVYDNEIRLRFYRDLPKDQAAERAKKNLPGFVQVGTIPWVTNNPGNITQTAGASTSTLQGFPADAQMGSIGTYGDRYSIFPSDTVGVQAISTYLRKLPDFGTNPNMTLAQAIKQYKGEEKGEKAKREAREKENAALAKEGKPLLPRIDVREDYLADVTSRSQSRLTADATPNQPTPAQSRDAKQGAQKQVGDLMKSQASGIGAGDATLAQVVESIHEVEGKAAAPGVTFNCNGFNDPTGKAAFDGEQKGIIKRLIGSTSALQELGDMLGCEA